jgi:methylenetetrahydrofolate--tRNA-(uracil-5-)-methyltransferase
VSNADPAHYQPTNITFGIIPPLDAPPKARHDRALAISDRALADLAGWSGELVRA